MSIEKPEIVTANRLDDGAVVYLTSKLGWSAAIAEAAVAFSDEEKAALMEIAEKAVRDRVVIGPYAMKAETGPAGTAPLSQRERIRAAGPTVRYRAEG